MYYLKSSIEEIEEVFKPYNYSGESIKTHKVKLPVYKDIELYGCVCHHFAYWDEFDYTSDCICMDEYLENNSVELENCTVEINYQEIETIINKEHFSEFLNVYITVLQNDYWENFNSELSKGNMLELSKIFKEKILSVKSCLETLKKIRKKENINWIQTNIIDSFSNSYDDLLKLIKVDYGDVFPSLISGYLSSNINSPSEIPVEKFLKPSAFKTFFEFEKRLNDKGYLDNSNNWIKEKKNLVLFFKYVRKAELLKEFYNWEDNNKFLRTLEKRYNCSVGDQGKPSKYNQSSYSSSIANAEFFFLNNT